jgi:hypothetical protein
MHFIKATKCFPCGGSQSWLQPAFSRLSPSRDSSVSAGKRCSRQGSPKYALSQPFSADARRLVHNILAAKITDSLQSAKGWYHFPAAHDRPFSASPQDIALL